MVKATMLGQLPLQELSRQAAVVAIGRDDVAVTTLR